jgi:O-antigen/teichoic acid export membrane protein
MTRTVVTTPGSAPGGATPPVAGPAQEQAAASRLVGRNAGALVISQFVTTPVSMVVSAMLARSLGVSNFGAIYLATTVLTLAFLLVEWGGQAAIAAEVARNPASAARLFGTGLVLRILLGGAMLLFLPRFAAWMGYDPSVRLAIALCGVRFAFTSLGTLCGAVVRGFEKVHWHAGATVFGKLIDAVLVIGVLLAGGGLRAALTAQVVAAAITLVWQIHLVLKLEIGRPLIDATALRLLVGGGVGFLVLDLVNQLQPTIDAAFLSKLAPAQALGWYSAASRISGVLLFPASTLSFALYPTVARLWQDDRVTYDAMVRLGLRSVTQLGVLAGMGTVIFSSMIVRLVYGAGAYGPAAMDLGILAPYVLLVYTSIILGTSILAAGKQWRWAAAQGLGVLVAVTLDPILIPWTQHRYGNGSVGVCISVVFAETVLVTAGLRLLPPGVLDKALARTLGRCLVAAGGMAAVGFILRGIPVLSIGATVAAYVGLLWVQQEIDPDLLIFLRTVGLSKLARAGPPQDGPENVIPVSGPSQPLV